MIREASYADIGALVDIHMRALPDDLLPGLGYRYLRDEFFPQVLKSKHAYTWVVDEANIVKAFLIVSPSPAKLTAELTKNRLKLFLHLMRGGLYSLKILKNIISIMQGCKQKIYADYEYLDISLVCEIYIIATAPGFQSKGFGGQLVEYGITELKEQCNQCLVKTSSENAKAFYRRNGFVEIGQELRGKKKYNILLLGL